MNESKDDIIIKEADDTKILTGVQEEAQENKENQCENDNLYQRD